MEEITKYLIKSTVDTKTVRAWEEDIVLPTYEIGAEEKNPIFLEKRVYQGSSGAVYPYPVVEKISDVKSQKTYHAIFIENLYIKVMILPCLGGRVHLAYDKIQQRHFVYYNQVVKPALVGLTGPWISGGIEFNFPQHHRPSTFLPTDYKIEENADGSKTVWCNEVERMSRLKDAHGFTLYPDKAFLEIKVRIYNRTAFPQTFLWWANPAVRVNDFYHSVFPPDVNAVFDHGKRDVSDFPIAHGVYYKQDYSAGVDISKYKNIPVPTSYMAVKSKYDFVGGYESDVRGGLLHVANHHVSPGKKQWTWGNSDFGQAWDRNLTDEDGPYIELMTGVYTDNQPDFSWLQPYETKQWEQYFMPYAEVGYVKNANKNAIINVELKIENGELNVILYTTSEYRNLRLVLKNDNEKIIFEEKTENVAPETPYKKTIKIENNHFQFSIFNFQFFTENGELLIDYTPEKNDKKPLPEPAKPAKLPQEIDSIEQLFLTGQHLEQYRHATYNPLDYYFEALRREPKDSRCNNAVGLLLMRKGQFAKAETYFRKAIETLTERNPNPYDGEAYYNLGLALKMKASLNPPEGQEKRSLPKGEGWGGAAYEAFYKATWNAAWQDAAYFSLAQIDCINANNTPCGAWGAALEHIEKSLLKNWHNHKARQLKTSILRKMGKTAEALLWCEESLKIDGFNVGCLFEKYLLTHDNAVLQELKTIMRGWVHNYLEYALDFSAAGLCEEATELLEIYLSEEKGNIYPMVYYTLAYINVTRFQNVLRLNETLEYIKKAEKCAPDYCFPNRIEEVIILQNAIAHNPKAAKANYYLGNFYYARQQYKEAIDCWEKSAAIDETFPTVFRNLALAYYNQKNDKKRALKMLECAFALDENDARILMELDQLYKKLGKPHAERLAFLEKHIALVEERDDLSIERITLYNQLGEYETAKKMIAGRKFHPWEGGEGKITGQYTLCRVELAKAPLNPPKGGKCPPLLGELEGALQLLHETDFYPENLGEGKLPNMEENDIDYYKGLIYKALGDTKNARKYLEKATRGSTEPVQAFFYNDSQPDKIFYQGLAWRELGDTEKAEKCFQNLIAHGEQHLNDNCRIDYFAVSLPDLAIWNEDLNERNRVHCHYVIGLGNLGLHYIHSSNEAHYVSTSDNLQRARQHLQIVCELDINHQGAQIHLAMNNEHK